MRTTLDLPTGLVEEAQRLLGFKSKTDTVVLSLRELIRRIAAFASSASTS